MSRFVAAVAAMALLLASCKDETAPAAEPTTAPVQAAAQEPHTLGQRYLRDAEEAKRGIDDFRFVFYSFPDPSRRWYFTGVIVSVPPTDPPAANTGADGVRVVRISPPEAERLIDRLAGDGFLFRGRQRADALGALPDRPYYRLGGSAGEDYRFVEYVKAGPEADARLEALAALLDPEAQDAVKRLVRRSADQRATMTVTE